MSLDIVPIINAARSHAMATGLFERTLAHEPRALPGHGVTWALWVQSIAPVPAGSGLAATTARVVFMVRLYSSLSQEPGDGIDPLMTAAVVGLMLAYSADYDLGGLVRNVDLLGQAGPGMFTQAGYLTQDNRVYRIYDLTLPVIVNDVFPQTA